MRILPEQCRAARALLGISQEELARLSGVSRPAIAEFERGATTPHPRTLRDLAEALEAQGVRLVETETETGAVLRRTPPTA